MAPEGRVKRATPNITRIIKILKQIINKKYKEGEAHDLKVSAEKMRNTSVNAMIDVIALYLDYKKGNEVSTKTHKVSWNSSNVDPISSVKDLILEVYMEGKRRKVPKTEKYQIYDFDFDFEFFFFFELGWR